VRIAGARVLLTGATGGLGQAIARALGARGAQLILTGRRGDVLESLASELGAPAISVDLADRADVARLIEEAGSVDVLVANAGLPGTGTLVELSQEEVDRGLEVNLRAPIALAHALLPAMRANRRGQLVFISSLSGKSASGSSSIYSATKFGLRGFGLSMRDELHGSGVSSSVICPGFIREAGMFAETGIKLPPGVGTRTPADVAAAVIRAIEHDRAEIDVAPAVLRVGAALAGLAPELSARVARLLGSNRVARDLTERQSHKR
jgi:short-subunit dehydrogenase